MLKLDDLKQWGDLKDAYGPASGIPILLNRLAQHPDRQKAASDEPWFTLWSSLCHQGNVYSASYAAVPHIVKLASETKGPIDFSFFLLPASIEVARNGGQGADLPKEFTIDYLDAIRKLSDAVTKHVHDDWDLPFTKSVCAALAVSKGHVELAERIINDQG
jgi:hypothetical protein